MRVGFHGTLQPVADALKLFTKEDILPSWADRRVYWLAPVAVFVPALLLWVTIPLARDLVMRNLDIGLFYITAISVLSVMGLIMAGWGSANKYAMLGGLRAAGQLVSYEIPFIMAILGVAMLAQSLDLTEVVDGQASFGNALVQPLGLFLFLTAGLAELGRTPFDIHHAESEVVGGPFVEYSGAHWAAFLPRRVPEHVHRRRPDGSAVPRRLEVAHDAIRRPGQLYAVRSLAPGEDVRRHLADLLDTRDISQAPHRPAYVVRLEDARPAVVPQHHSYGGRPVLRLAAVGADDHLSGIIGGHRVRDCQKARLASGEEHCMGASCEQLATTEIRDLEDNVVATEDRIARLETKVDGLYDRIDGLYDRISRVEGVQEQMSKRMDDMYKLLITLIAIGGGGLITAVVSLVLQLIRQ